MGGGNGGVARCLGERGLRRVCDKFAERRDASGNLHADCEGDVGIGDERDHALSYRNPYRQLVFAQLDFSWRQTGVGFVALATSDSFDVWSYSLRRVKCKQSGIFFQT